MSVPYSTSVTIVSAGDYRTGDLRHGSLDVSFSQTSSLLWH
ncbi:hypothetical protein [Desulfosporosinus nitroreducens]|nr:hypothetical protein [Desulfosporosinus nitroreducens]